MPSDQEITPEEKLLKVIQSGGPAPGAARKQPASVSPDTDKTVTAETRIGPKPVAKIKPRVAGKPAVVLGASKKKDKPTAEPAQEPEKAAKKSPASGDGEKGAGRKDRRGKAPASDGAALGGTPPPEEPAEPEHVHRRKIEHSPTLTIRVINRMLAASFIALMVGFVWEIRAARPVAPRDVDEEPRIVTPDVIVGLGEVKDYVTPAEERNIWLPPNANAGGIVDPDPDPPADDWSGKVKQYADKSLRLVGVSIYDEEPERSFGVVDDKVEGTSYNLRLNDKVSLKLRIDGSARPFDFTVKKVAEDELILDFEGSEIRVAGKE